MKICDLTQFYSPVSGGVKRYVQEKVRYLDQRAPDDEHILIIPGEKDSVQADGRARTYTIKSPLVSRTSRYRALIRLERVEQILCAERPDIIESGDPYQVAWKAVASGKALRIPVIGFYHSHFPEAYLRSVSKFFGRTASDFVMDLSRRYVCHLYNHFERTLVPSPALGAVLRDWGVTNTENIDLGVNVDLFGVLPDDAAATRAGLGIPETKLVLLYVGRLAQEKNTQTLFNAFRLLALDQPGRFHLLVVGDGLQRPELQSLVGELAAATAPGKSGAAPSPVTHLPYCGDSRRLAELYRAADLFVHPGVQETFGLVALESQACGTPVIGIRGSYMDRIIHSDQAFWAPGNNPESLARAILDASTQDLRSGGAELSRAVTSRYSWTRVFDRLFSIYRIVAREYRNPRS